MHYVRRKMFYHIAATDTDWWRKLPMWTIIRVPGSCLQRSTKS